MRIGLRRALLRCLAGSILGAAPASALTIGFSASDGNFQPTTAVGTLALELSLAELIASDTGGFLVPLGVAATAAVTLTVPPRAPSETAFSFAPRFATSTETLVLQVELLAGSPALVELTVNDPAGWRGCIADPATCARRALTVTVPGGFGPGVAVGPTFDSDWASEGYQVDFQLPETGAAALLALALAALTWRRPRRGRSPQRPLP